MRSRPTIRHLRHATCLLTIAGQRLLVDPMLAAPGELPPIPLTRNRRKNPLVPLPVTIEELQEIDAILLTHRHIDHWDRTAERILRKDVPLFCQPRDAAALQSAGFQHVIAVTDEYDWRGLQLTRVPAQHGHGVIGRLLGSGSGYVLRDAQNQSVYIAGDSVHADCVRQTIARFQPQMIILNAGAAQFIFGAAITMTADDVISVCRDAPTAMIIVLHLEAINHCGLSRRELADRLSQAHVGNRVRIPSDGEAL